jgi:hypothetical protein
VCLRGPIHSGTIHSPVCPCPDDHIRKAIARILADALVKDYCERTGLPSDTP